MSEKSRVRSLVESRIFWKYLCLILAMIIVAFYLRSKFSSAFSTEDLANGIFYSIVTSLVVSLFYDIGTRRDVATLLQEERDQYLHLLTHRLLRAIDLDKLPRDDALDLSRQLANNERMMELIAITLLGEQGRTFFYTWLKPLIDKRVLYSVIVENRLCRVNGREDAYWMELRQTFRASSGKSSYLVVFTCDNELYNDFVTSDVVVDELVGISREEWGDIDAQISSFVFRAYRSHMGKRESGRIAPRSVPVGQLGADLHPIHNEDDVRGLEFSLLAGEDWTYEYEYRVRNRLSDPYYVWTAVNPMFISKLVIDYREVKSMVGRVSANCILGSTSSEPHHDSDVGVYIINAESLVWPGQGAMIVWRPRIQSSPGSVVKSDANNLDKSH